MYSTISSGQQQIINILKKRIELTKNYNAKLALMDVLAEIYVEIGHPKGKTDV